MLPPELEAIVARVEGVRFVEQMLLGMTSNTSVVPVSTIALSGLQLPRLKNVAVSEGAATPLGQLRQARPL